QDASEILRLAETWHHCSLALLRTAPEAAVELTELGQLERKFQQGFTALVSESSLPKIHTSMARAQPRCCRSVLTRFLLRGRRLAEEAYADDLQERDLSSRAQMNFLLGYEDLTEGKLVYWMNADKDVDRNELGKITQVPGDYDKGVLLVKFSAGKFPIEPRWLCAADIQVGAFVQVAGDSDEVIGEVKRVDDGKEVVVEVKGEDQKYKPKKLILCDFQPEMLVFWTKADDDIPRGHLGVVLKDLNDSGRVKVKFPKGSWRFKPSEIVRAPIQPQSYVQWT
ncbi:DEK1, partial [Symbiodinium necroappetens]